MHVGFQLLPPHFLGQLQCPAPLIPPSARQQRRTVARPVRLEGAPGHPGEEVHGQLPLRAHLHRRDQGVPSGGVRVQFTARHIVHQLHRPCPLPRGPASQDGGAEQGDVLAHTALQGFLEQDQGLPPSGGLLAGDDGSIVSLHSRHQPVLPHGPQQLQRFRPPTATSAGADGVVVRDRVDLHTAPLHLLQQAYRLLPLPQLSVRGYTNAARDGVGLPFPQQLQCHAPLPGLHAGVDDGAVHPHVGLWAPRLCQAEDGQCVLPPRGLAKRIKHSAQHR
mmetsp:Transcript_48440/g.152164  ORF Transcript_48440/g.152164 Transcript_48440/m.152164 type:complete len:277 (+) Transcript_48440:1460-2290(+)